MILKNTIRMMILVIFMSSLYSQTWAATIVTTDQNIVDTFQSGASILGFDALPPNGGGGSSGNTGTPIQPESQLADQFLDLGVIFSSTGGSVGVVGAPSDAVSPSNVIGGSSIGSTLPVLNYFEPISLQFVSPNTTTPSTTIKIGAWNDPTGSLIQLSVFDINGNLLESAQADQGFFIGISNPLIASATFSYISTQSVNGYSLDDVTFGAVSVVPVPAAAWLFGSGLIGLVCAAKRKST
ncbi:MAG: VPLPA-CTERM sorting domain-containing protein [Candidatus Thiodiazotropha sp.]